MTAVLGCIKRVNDWEFIQINSEYELNDFLEIVSIERPKEYLIVNKDNTKILTVNQAKHELRKGDVHAQ